LTPKKNIQCKYYAYSVNSILKFFGGNTAVSQLSAEQISPYKVLCPPLSEQEGIATYLDDKTSKIDDLISKKQRMIELLKEQRAAVINEAVTKGLNPDVKMKDSGVEWIGKVPDHWAVKKLKFNANVKFSNVNKKFEEGEELVKLCNYVDVYYNDYITKNIEFMEATATKEEIKKFLLETEDVLLTKDSEEWSDIAIPAYVKEILPNLICGYHLAQIRTEKNKLSGKYLFWVLKSEKINHQYKIEATGVTRYGLGNYALSNSLITLPPLSEQSRISEYLEQKNNDIDLIITEEQEGIKYLKEYRMSLISEAVTGKIKI
jgi:type I restriction enzyme S subunit